MKHGFFIYPAVLFLLFTTTLFIVPAFNAEAKGISPGFTASEFSAVALVHTSPVSCSDSNGIVTVFFHSPEEWEARLYSNNIVLQTKRSATANINFEDLSAGDYTVEIWKNNTLFQQEKVTVAKPTVLKSAFAVSADTVYAGQKVFLENDSEGGNHWYWEFGDAHTSQEYEPSYVYAIPGTYTLTLTTANVAGCITSSSKIIHVKNSPSKSLKK